MFELCVFLYLTNRECWLCLLNYIEVLKLFHFMCVCCHEFYDMFLIPIIICDVVIFR
jgi:hypothetical protein